MNFPPHKCGLYLEHNRHRDAYERIEVAVQEIDEDAPDAWISPLERQVSLLTGELWSLQWYPETPVGFQRVVGASLEAVLLAAEAV